MAHTRFLVAFQCLFVLCSTAYSNSYEFVKIADNSPQSIFLGFANQPVLSNHNGVVFSAQIRTGGSGLFEGSGGVTKVLDFSAGSSGAYGTPTASPNGEVIIFVRTFNGGIFLVTDGHLRSILDVAVDGDLFGGLPGSANVNNAGTAVFASRSRSGTDGIYTGTGESHFNTIAEANPASIFEGFGFQSMTQISIPSINNLGVVAFVATMKDSSHGLFISSAGTVHPIVTSAGGLFTAYGGYPSINDSSHIAFLADKGLCCGPGLPGVEGVYLSEGGGLKLLPRLVWGVPLSALAIRT